MIETFAPNRSDEALNVAVLLWVIAARELRRSFTPAQPAYPAASVSDLLSDGCSFKAQTVGRRRT